MQEPLPVKSILDMAILARQVAGGERRPEEFFKHWPDISKEEDREVKELWFQVQYYENDVVHASDSAEFYRTQILKLARQLEERFKVKWRSQEED